MTIHYCEQARSPCIQQEMYKVHIIFFAYTLVGEFHKTAGPIIWQVILEKKKANLQWLGENTRIFMYDNWIKVKS